MRGSVSGQADSSPIPTITVTRHQSVSKHFWPECTVVCSSTTETPPKSPEQTQCLQPPALFFFFFSPAVAQNPCAHLNLASVQLPCTCSCGVECSGSLKMFCITLKRQNCSITLFSLMLLVVRKHCRCFCCSLIVCPGGA